MLSPGLRRPVSILVLYSHVEVVTEGEPLDLIADQETVHVAHEISAGLQEVGYRTACVGVTDDVATALAPFSPAEWVVFNLCESLGGDAAREPSVPPVLEAHGFAYTGSPGPVLAACLDKARTKKTLAAHGLATPRYAVLSSPDQPSDVPLPALVKPAAEDASAGITLDSVVRDPTALARQVAYILERYRQPALVEEFVAGREFNAAIWGNDPPEPLPLSEIIYQGIEDPLQRLLTYESKWVESSFAYLHTPAVCPAAVDAALGERLMHLALGAYRLMGCRGYARVDMRERDGVPYILEVNPNPSLVSDGGFARAVRAAGFNQGQMARQIVHLALEHAPATCPMLVGSTEAAPAPGALR